MRDTYLVFGQPRIEQAEIDEVAASMRSAWLGTGPKAAEFERRVAALREDLRSRSGLPLPTLSLGMSGDLAPAIAAGSTMVRVGTSLFGARS